MEHFIEEKLAAQVVIYLFYCFIVTLHQTVFVFDSPVRRKASVLVIFMYNCSDPSLLGHLLPLAATFS